MDRKMGSTAPRLFAMDRHRSVVVTAALELNSSYVLFISFGVNYDTKIECRSALIIRLASTLIVTRGQSNLTKSASRGAHSPVTIGLGCTV